MTAIIEKARGLSRASKAVIIGAALLILIAATGVLRADSDLKISGEEATVIAEQQLDFSPEQTAVRLVREGIGLEPVWAVSFSIPGTGNEEFAELLVVEVDAITGEIRQISRG